MSEKQKQSNKDHRVQLKGSQVSCAMVDVNRELNRRLQQKGMGAWLSRHEVLGFLTEEYTEVVEAVHSGSLDDLKEELMDVAVGCIFAVACINEKTLDW